MKKIGLISLALIFLMSSCRETEENISKEIKSEVKSIDDYFNFLRAEVDGEIFVSSFNTVNSLTSVVPSLNSSIGGDRKPLSLIVDDKIVANFNDYNYSARANKSFIQGKSFKDLKSVYGNSFEVTLKDNNISARSTGNINHQNKLKSVYIPHLIKMKLENLKDGKMIVGTQVVWNKDVKNKNGVVIIFGYTPQLQMESVADKMTELKDYGITTEDTGRYVITAKDLDEFEDKSYITFSIIRAGYGITNENNKDYSIAAYTEIQDFLQINKK